jgi:putative NADPH-quinone reductase
MAKRILIINAHPDKSERHLCTVLAEAYMEGASSSGSSIRRIDLANVDFPFLQSQKQFESGYVPEELQLAVEDIEWAEHLVFVFPLWLGTMPALLKAFLEQVMRPGVAFRYRPDHRGAISLLKGRSARLIVTMGMPTIVFRLWFRGHGIKLLRRSILNFAGIRPVGETLFGGVEGTTEAKRKQWIAEVRSLGTRAA